jgi:FkbM family methyltransferase
MIATIRDHTFITRGIGRQSTIVDLGAHRCEFSQEISKQFGSRCFAVEAAPSLFSEIANNERITCFHYAMAGTDGELQFNISEDPEGSSIKDHFAGKLTKQVTVPCRTLKTFLAENRIERVDLLKVDIEGAEVDLLAATPPEIFQKINQISVEFHDFSGSISLDDVARTRLLLERNGFVAIRFSMNNMNWLFVHPERLGLNWFQVMFIKYGLRNARGLARKLRAA